MNRRHRPLVMVILLSAAWGSESRISAAETNAEPSVVAPAGLDIYLQPLVTRFGQVFPNITFSSGFYYFHDLEMQEADQFNGYTVDVELAVPFFNRFQVRLGGPVYTDGDARLTDEGQPVQDIDIDGAGGTFEYPTASLDFQILNEDSNPLNLMVWGGFGYVLEPLETSAGDLFNHKGRNAQGGVRADRALGDHLRVAANAGFTYYSESDDLNPAEDGDDIFTLTHLSASANWRVWQRGPVPALELSYTGDFGSYNTLHLIPQFLWQTCRYSVFKAGALIGLTDDGQDFGAQVQAQLNF